MDKKIATYTEHGIRLQLLEITTEDDHFNQYQIPIGGKKYYQIRENRKRLCTFKWETPARQKFNALIQQHLLQTSINYEEKKLYKTTMGGKFYIEEKEITKYEYQKTVYNNIHNIGNPVLVNYTDDKRFVKMKETTYEEYKKI